MNTEKKTSHGIPTTDQIVEGTSVYDVAVLKLTYVKDGQTYNAYAVTKPTSNITGSSSDSHTSFLDDFGEYGKYIGVIFLIIVFAALAPCIKPVSEGLVAIIRLPFDLIASIFKKKK